MTIENGLHVLVRLQNFEEMIDIDKVTVVMFQRMMHEQRRGSILCSRQILREPIALGFAKLAGYFVLIHKRIENNQPQQWMLNDQNVFARNRLFIARVGFENCAEVCAIIVI